MLKTIFSLLLYPLEYLIGICIVIYRLMRESGLSVDTVAPGSGIMDAMNVGKGYEDIIKAAKAEGKNSSEPESEVK